LILAKPGCGSFARAGDRHHRRPLLEHSQRCGVWFNGIALVSRRRVHVAGSSAFEGGARTTALGRLMHCGVAFGCSAVFVFVVMRSAWVLRVLASQYGSVKVASVYGPFIWLVMSLVVIPLLLHRPPAISIRWWVQLLGHFPFVGIPIVLSASSGVTRSESETAHA